MELKSRTSGEKLIIDLPAEIDISNLQDIEAFVNGAGEKIKEIIFNFDEVFYIDSAGLYFLLKLNLELRKKGGSLEVHNVFGETKRIFDISAIKDHLVVLDTLNSPAF